MNVIEFGATGMVGQGVLRECLLDPSVRSVLSVGRRASDQHDPKLQEILWPDLTDLGPLEDRLHGYDACFFCLGVSSAGMAEEVYRSVTYDLTVAVAGALASLNPEMTFVYVSGAGTDSTEHGRSMWARVKGETENALLRMPFKAAYMFRPGVIRLMHGIRSRTRGIPILYMVMSPAILLAAAVAPNSITSTEKMGRAMIRVAQTGAPERLLGTRAINDLARRTA